MRRLVETDSLIRWDGEQEVTREDVTFVLTLPIVPAPRRPWWKRWWRS